MSFETFYETFQSLRQTYRVVQPGSLTDITKISRVEPLTILSKDAVLYEGTPDILSVLLNIFSGYYFQAASIVGKINHIKIFKTLDSLNPNRTFDTALMTVESDRSYLRDPASYKYTLPLHRHALENDSNRNDSNAKLITEVSNQAVGKILNISIELEAEEKNQKGETSKNTRSVSIPVLVRLIPSAVSQETLVHLLTMKSVNHSLTERYHAWRSGRIRFINDLIFCQDIIQDYRKALMSDDRNIIQQVQTRAFKNQFYGIVTQNPSLAGASNLFVLTESAAKAVESKIGGRLSNTKVREKLFHQTSGMVMAVIDRQYDRTTFYHRGVDGTTELSLKEIKKTNQSKGPDIAELVKALMAGQAPMF